MNQVPDAQLDGHYRQFDRDHARLRSELIASLPAATDGEGGGDEDEATTPAQGRLRRPVLGLAAVLVAGVGAAGLLLWLSPGSAVASEVFADVLDRVRRAASVSYTSVLTLPGRSEQTARITFAEPQRQRKTIQGGGVQISDFGRGKILYVAPGCCRWALSVAYDPAPHAALQGDALDRLKRLTADAGEFVGTRRLGRRVTNVFEIGGENQEMTVWADAETDLPVRVKVVATTHATADSPAASATLVLSDFVWNQPVDDSLFDSIVPQGYRRYHFDLMDAAAPVVERDLVDSLRILADLAGGVFPPSLQSTDVKPLLKPLDGSGAAVIDLETGLNIVAGAVGHAHGADEPAMLQVLRRRRKRLQVARGIAFVNQLTAGARPWRYVGAGVRQGEEHLVFWYQMQDGRTYRAVYGDGSTGDVSPGRLGRPVAP